MNDEVRAKLGEIVARHGVAVVEDPRRCEALLRDHCGANRREIFVLVSALEEGVAGDLLGTRGRVPVSLLVGQLAARLTEHLALSPEASRWAVESWALALGAATPAELERPAPPAPVPEAPAARSELRATRPPPAAPLPARARTTDEVFVDAAGAGDFTTVSDAVARAPDGARVIVRPGTYDEELVLTRRVEIVGGGRVGEVVIQSG